MFWLEGRGSGHIEEGSGVWESPKDLCRESQEVWADCLQAKVRSLGEPRGKQWRFSKKNKKSQSGEQGNSV